MKRQPQTKVRSLVILLIIQSMAAAFFMGDVIADLSFEGLDAHVVFEAVVAVALVIGVAFGVREMRRTLERTQRSEAALSVARGALADLMEQRFEEWTLTPAEREIALLALKGFDINEMSALRDVAAGTVRAQLSRLYRKSGVSNRTELLSLFVDDLLDAPIVETPGEFKAARPPTPLS